MRKKAGLLVWTACAALSASCVAGTPLAQAGPSGNARPLASIGVTPSLIYDGSITSTVAGGIKRGTAYIGNLHLQALFSGDRLLHLKGLTAFTDILDVHGSQPSDFAGDAQSLSNLEAAPVLRLYEAWLQYNFAASHLSILAGRYDLNTEFYSLNSAHLFLNSSFGIGPDFSQSGVNGPSIFPDTSVGFRLDVKPIANIVWRTAVLDAVPAGRPSEPADLFSKRDGLLIVSEVAYLTGPGRRKPPGRSRSLIGRASDEYPYQDKIAIGGWFYTHRFDEISAAGKSAPQHHSRGAYLIADKLLYRSASNEDRSVAGFVQAGMADDRVNRFEYYVGAGIVASGFVAGRPNDEAGLAVATAVNGHPFLMAERQLGTPNNRSETAIETTYLAQISPWLAVQPDLQYVIHPNTDPQTKNALVFQLEFEIAL